MEKLNVLVLGDGLLGGEIIKQTGWDYLSRKKDGFDILNIEGSINEKYDIIVNCIANTDSYSTEIKKHWDTNYVFVNELIKYCNIIKAKLIHISSDFVYAGSTPNATELDIPISIQTPYGYTKLLSDGLVQLQTKDYLLIRCSFKPSPWKYDNAWVDVYGCFDSVDIIAGLIIKCINKNASGVLNLGTPSKSIYELAIRTNPNVIKSLAPIYVPHDITMDLSKLNKFLCKQ